MIDNTRGAAFFAALNTGNGFKSYFREIFDKVERVYIIKGGSGTGKSRFMRELEAAAHSRGYAVEEILCSSDPASLDGIIIKRLGIAVLDGTAPHVHEPTLVGARELFIDLSVFLDCNSLKEYKAEIQGILNAKSYHYGSVYKKLKCISILDQMIKEAALNAYDEAKLSKSVDKMLKFIKGGSVYEKNIRIRSAISCMGHIVLNTYAKMSGKRFVIADICGLGGIYLKALLEKTDALGISVTVSYSPFFPDLPDALYYPDSDVAFYIGAESDFDETVINMRRFVNDEVLRPYKSEIRALYRIRKELIGELNSDFSAIRRLHEAVEKIYSSSMRFEDKEELTRDFIQRIFK